RASRFKHPRLMGIVVSAVGPLSNLLVGALGVVLLYVLNETGLLHAGSIGVYSALVHFFYYLITINLLLFVFNLIPLPPLDGYRILADLLPLRIRFKMEQNVQWGMFIFLLIVFIPPLRAVTLDPILNLSSEIFFMLINWCESLFTPFDWQRFIMDFTK
ncbi:site-2 protease family protein, partial [Paenibacillus sp. MCAF20]